MKPVKRRGSGMLTRLMSSPWLQRVRLQYTAGDLLPTKQIRFCPPSAVYAFESLEDDPQFRLRHPVNAGWYMAEVGIDAPVAQVDARFYLNVGAGDDEKASLGLPIRPGQIAKRLVYVPERARLRFDPISHAGVFSLAHFRLVRMPQGAARKRLLKKLKRLHPRYRNGFIPSSEAAVWADYNSLFEHVTGEPQDYARWIAQVEAPAIPQPSEQLEEIRLWAWKPRFSIVLPTYNTPADLLNACIDSVCDQTYPDWELCIADDASSQAHVRNILRDRASRDSRIKIVLRSENGHISRASNSALELATGDFVVLLDHDDLLAGHALFALAQALQARPSAQIIYSDEDKLDESGQRCEPFFKPDWSPDLLYAQNYVSHLGVYRRELVQAVGGFRADFEGSQDYDLVLRCAAKVKDDRDIVHVPQVLYHWRKTESSTARGHSQKDYASLAGHRALQEFMDQQHPGVKVSTRAPGIYSTAWPIPEPAPLVSLIVPTRDSYEILKKCVDSILDKTTYPNYEILIVDNQSSCARTLEYMRLIAAPQVGPSRVRVLRYDRPFNYSAINNYAVGEAHGSIVGLVNNDVEVIASHWLSEMVSHVVRPQIGCVGAKLLYPNDTIQHAGVVLGIGGVANHALRLTPAHAPGYFGRLWTTHNPSAVTGACLLIRKAVYQQVGGLDADALPVAFNDVDLGLKVLAAGYRNLWTPGAELYHHESATRGADEAPEKKARFQSEIDTMRTRWAALLDSDPAYNPNLTRVRDDYSLDFARRPALTIEAQ